MTDFKCVKYTEEEFEKFSPEYLVELYHTGPSWCQGIKGSFLLEKSAFLAVVNDDGTKRPVIVEKKTWDQDQSTTLYEVTAWDDGVAWQIRSEFFEAELAVNNGKRPSFKVLDIYGVKKEEV